MVNIIITQTPIKSPAQCDFPNSRLESDIQKHMYEFQQSIKKIKLNIKMKTNDNQLTRES